MTTSNASEEKTVEAATDSNVTADAVNEAQANEAINAGYNRIANPNQQEEAKEEKPQTVETPPETAFTNEQAQQLTEQVARITDLEKRLRDEGGRYGSLKQTVEQLQQRIATSDTAKEVAESAVNVDELLKELRGESDSGFPELADALKPAFEKLLAAKGNSKSFNPDDIEKLVMARLEAEQSAQTEDGMKQLSELHPDWLEVRAKPEFDEWKASIPERERVRFEKSRDPFYVAEMLDKHKDWLKSKTTPTKLVAEKQTNDTAVPPKRLAAAVLPTSGTKVATKGEPDPKASIRAGYERIAGARMR